MKNEDKRSLAIYGTNILGSVPFLRTGNPLGAIVLGAERLMERMFFPTLETNMYVRAGKVAAAGFYGVMAATQITSNSPYTFVHAVLSGALAVESALQATESYRKTNTSPRQDLENIIASAKKK